MTARTTTLGLTAVSLLGAGLVTGGDNGPVLCPFRHVTGGYCPACGMTRALARLLRGDVVGSWHQHPFLLLALAQVALAAVAWTVAERRRRGPAPNLVLTLAARRSDSLLAANGALLVALWIVRLATHVIPAPFAQL